MGQLATSVVIANWFIRKRGRAVAIRGSGARLGHAVMPLMIFAVMAVSSWRYAYASLAGMSVLLLIAPAAVFMRRRPEDLGLQPDGEERRESDLSSGSGPRRWPEVSLTLREAIHTRALWLIIVTVGAGLFAMGAVNLHMIANFQDQGISAGKAVSVTSVFAATSAASMVPLGLLMERLHVRYGTMLVAGILMVAMIIVIKADTYPLAMLFGVVFGVGGGGWVVVQSLLFADYFGRHHLGAIRGFAAPITGSFSTLGPVVAGLVRDVSGSYTPAFLAFMGLFALMIVAMALAVPPQRQAPISSGQEAQASSPG